MQGNLEAIQQHIKAGSDLNEKEPSRGSSPLITAAVFGKTEVARALIEAGAEVNFQNNDGSTALHSAVFFCRTEIVKLLLENDANKTLKNNAGRTALESVSAPFENVKGIYDQLGAALGPLGGFADFPYKDKKLHLSAVDTVLFLSDGFEEMFNQLEHESDKGSKCFVFVSCYL